MTASVRYIFKSLVRKISNMLTCSFHGKILSLYTISRASAKSNKKLSFLSFLSFECKTILAVKKVGW